jgi:hypothetical protein
LKRIRKAQNTAKSRKEPEVLRSIAAPERLPLKSGSFGVPVNLSAAGLVRYLSHRDAGAGNDGVTNSRGILRTLRKWLLVVEMRHHASEYDAARSAAQVNNRREDQIKCPK